jgi:hypothetical protein
MTDLSEMSKRERDHHGIALEQARKAGLENPVIVEHEEWDEAIHREAPSIEWRRSDITGALLRITGDWECDLIVEIRSNSGTSWRLQRTPGGDRPEEKKVMLPTEEQAIEWIEENGTLKRGWPMMAWVHYFMSVGFGRTIASSELKRSGDPVLRVLREKAPAEAGFENGGWVIERLEPLARKENAQNERSAHPMFEDRRVAMEYAEGLIGDNSPPDVEPVTETVETQYRVADR